MRLIIPFQEQDGAHYGIYNSFTGTGIGTQSGSSTSISNSGNGVHYGAYAYLSGSGSGNKYGSYNKVVSTAGGTHYAVYGEAEKADSYAGYFKGDVEVTEKVTAPVSGDSDMKAYIYGAVRYDGVRLPAGSSDGFTVARISAGLYRIYFSEAQTNIESYSVITTMKRGAPDGDIGFISFKNSSNTYFEIHTNETNAVSEDRNFMFVVYAK